MLYTMRQTQLHLDDQIWMTLQTQAQIAGETVSELVSRAARDRYKSNPEELRKGMIGIVGLWKDRTDIEDSETYVRNLRSGTRLKRLGIE